MKKSNLLLMMLSLVLLLGLFITDRLLAVNYTKIDLKDMYKNFQDIAVKPFKALNITGGNSYAIRIKQGRDYNIKVMNSRKSFFKTISSGDTLAIVFSVANQQYQKPEDCVTGVIITVPSISLLKLSGINAEIGPFSQNALTIIQNNYALARLKELNLDYLNLQGSEFSSFDCVNKNNVKQLDLTLTSNASIQMKQISFQQFNPVLKDSAAIVLYKQSFEMFSKNYSALPDSLSLPR